MLCNLLHKVNCLVLSQHQAENNHRSTLRLMVVASAAFAAHAYTIDRNSISADVKNIHYNRNSYGDMESFMAFCITIPLHSPTPAPLFHLGRLQIYLLSGLYEH